MPRPLAPQTFVVLVPAAPSNTHIKAGSGIVCDAASWAAFQGGRIDHVIVAYEGNLYDAVNMREYDERVFHAAARLAERYPTVAKSACFDKCEFREVGEFLYGTPNLEGRPYTLLIEDKVAVEAWKSTGTAPEAPTPSM